MTVGSKDLTVDKLAGLGTEELGQTLRNAKEELFNLRFQAATGQLENTARLKAVKRDIARVYTVLRERELGIRESVDIDDAADETEAEADTLEQTKA